VALKSVLLISVPGTMPKNPEIHRTNPWKCLIRYTVAGSAGIKTP
jgi:hypothetical protein